MKWREYTGLFFVIGMVACTPPEPKPPIAQDVMINVLVDLRTLEGAYATALTKPDTLRAHMAEQYQMVFSRQGITHEQYIDAYQFFMARPDQMEAIEDSVIDRISERLNTLQYP